MLTLPTGAHRPHDATARIGRPRLRCETCRGMLKHSTKTSLLQSSFSTNLTSRCWIPIPSVTSTSLDTTSFVGFLTLLFYFMMAFGTLLTSTGCSRGQQLGALSWIITSTRSSILISIHSRQRSTMLKYAHPRSSSLIAISGKLWVSGALQ